MITSYTLYLDPGEVGMEFVHFLTTIIKFTREVDHEFCGESNVTTGDGASGLQLLSLQESQLPALCCQPSVFLVSRDGKQWIVDVFLTECF